MCLLLQRALWIHLIYYTPTNALLYCMWCVQVLRSPNFFLGNGSR